MINQLLKITRFISKNKSIKMLAVILIVGIFFFHPAYANENSSTLLNDTQQWLSNGVGFLSRIWIFLAMIAGKFMTNDVVYGAFMNLDKYLWAIWNVMKNFANFGLAAMILVSIIKYVIDKKGDDPKKIVIKSLVAGVLIQMSWFLVGALVDLSTVATSAVAAFPANFIGSNYVETSVATEMGNIFKAPQYIAKIDEKGQIGWEKPKPRSDAGSCVETDFDAMMPKYDSVSGPLIFIGMSFLKTQSYMDNGVLPDNASGGGQLIINLALKLLILLAYVGCLIGLVIANLVRVLFLRLLILASPVVVLLGVFGKKMEGEGFTKYFNLATFVDLIFKPVFFIGFLGMTLIFVSSMQQIMGGGKGIQDMNGVTISTVTGEVASSTISMTDIADFTVNGDIFKDIAGGTRGVFVDLMLIVMTLLLLWQMLKFSVEFGGGPIKDVMDKITPLVESLGANLPIVPTKGGEKMGIKNLMDASSASTKKMLKSFGVSEKGRFFESEKNFQDRVNATFLGQKPSWSEQDTTELSRLIKTDDDKFRPAFLKKGQDTNGGVSLSNPDQYKLVEQWFDHVRREPEKLQAIFGSTADRAETGTLEDYLSDAKDSSHLKLYALHNYLGGNKNLPTQKTTKPASFTEVKNNRYRYEPDKE